MNATAAGRSVVETDVVIVGAGPVALFQVFQLGLLELRAEVVDSLPYVGGQCVELYADKPIYDIPSIPVCSGRELVERLQKQASPFQTGFHLGRQVSAATVRDDGRFDVETDLGDRFACGAVVIAAGVGAFMPRRLKLDGLDRHRGTQLFEVDPGVDASAGRHVVVVGGTGAVVGSALGAVAADAASVTVVHRKDDFDADTPMLDAFANARAAGRIAFVAGQPSAVREDAAGRLGSLVVAANDGSDPVLPCDLLLVLLGWSPKLGPIAHWGLALEKKQLVVDTERFETSVPGIHAVGDVNTYPGKLKLIVSGFHEATLAARAISARIHPDRHEPLLYTTTSPKLHRLLKVQDTTA